MTTITTIPQMNTIELIPTLSVFILWLTPVTSTVYARDANSECAEGFICNNGKTENCTEIQRKVRDDFKFGNILAGISCPNGTQNMLNCPIGYICETPTSKHQCPSGKYCPHKTAMAEIECSACGQGSSSLERPMFGYILLVLVAILSFSYMAFSWFTKKNQRLADKLKDLQKRRLDNKKAPLIEKENHEKINKMRPQLEILMKRVDGLRVSESGHQRSSVCNPIKFNDDGSIDFDAGEFYDGVCCGRADGSVSYRELNKVLKLNTSQLKEFVHRMNTLGDVPRGTKTVIRALFADHFIQVFSESKYFGPTPQECATLFDDIAKNIGVDHEGNIPESLFFISELSTFLSDSQINHVLTRIRQLRREEQSNQTLGRPLGRTASTAWQASVFNPANIRQRHSPRLASTRSVFADRPAYGTMPSRNKVVFRHDFVKYFPMLLKEATLLHLDEIKETDKTGQEKKGIDICFHNLSLTLTVGSGTVRVVDSVTGRLQPSTMTALMGGSGAGKTSLLNALCGRASYGKVTGVTKINGKIAAIDEHSTLVGFVPQDDIVYPELTVRENFIYSGRFRLPQGTDISDIEDLADQTIANLGLSRVGDTIVGDVKRRGVSGGEKKRVNIGLELMAKPSTLFLDEPTSGLDSSSAFLVMNCVRSLVDKHGLSACSVIHQPRKSIFDLFDSLILLGAGGKMVYHGAICDVEEYFTGLNYVSQPGESLADWLIDISTGHLKPKVQKGHVNMLSLAPSMVPSMARPQREMPQRGMSGGLEELGPGNLSTMNNERSVNFESPSPLCRRTSTQTYISHGFANSGPSGKKEENDEEQAKVRRERLFRKWNEYFEQMTEIEKQAYSPPEEYDIPIPENKPPFGCQLNIQMKRYCLVWRRNFSSKLIDTVIIVGTAALISAMAGKAEVTVDKEIDIPYEKLASNHSTELIPELPKIFEYALLADEDMQKFSLRFGLVLVVLIGLTASKDITDKQTEFFREAASGYDVNAYFLAVNIMSSVEHLSQSFVAALFAWWIRQSISKWLYFCISFLSLSWFAISWSLLIPLLVPPSNVTIVVGFFMTFFGLLFGGSLEPITFEKIYGSWGLQLFCGFFSPSRYFIESISVAEHRCLPEQSGYTMTEEASNFPMDVGSFSLLGLAGNDESVTDQSCKGWYRGLVAPIFVGFFIRYLGAGLIHVSGRSKQAKKPLREDLIRDPRLRLTVLLYLVILLILFIFVALLILAL